jgi:hypothetical protein
MSESMTGIDNRATAVIDTPDPAGALPTFPPLEATCKYCGGNPYRGRCTNCDGRGTVPTAFGQAIIDLLAKYVSSEVNDY